ncbi:hypothetical protein ABPG75_008843 [Micractinium tetrahymenae]
MGSAGRPSLFKTSASAAELASADVAGYAEPGLSEHKNTPGGHHLDPYWHKGRGGLRPEGEDFEDEEARLRELEAHNPPSLVSRARQAVGAVGSTLQSMAGRVMPSMFRSTPSTAELAMADAEGYAEPGLLEHKGTPGGHHLDPHWHKGRGGLREEGEDYEEEEARLHELEGHQDKGVVERAKEAASATAAAATEKAGEMLQARRQGRGMAAKEMVGMEPKK